MAKFQSPLLGYNNNVRHRGRLFHIQTEDSGVNHPHVITHVFMDGGRILKSQKRSYAEHVGTDGLNETVKQLMKEQHKAMFIALRDGQFDDLVENATVGAPAPAKPVANAPAPVPSAAAPPSAPAAAAAAAVEAAPPTPQAIAISAALIAAAPPPATRPEAPPPFVADPPKAGVAVAVALAADEAAPPTVSDAAPPPALPSLPRAGVGERATRVEVNDLSADHPKTTREPDRGRPSVQELTLDFDAFEQDTMLGLNPLLEQNALPPPPKNLFASSRVEPGSSTYRTLDQPAEETRAPASSARAASRPSTPPRPGTEGRYAPARPAAIFGTTAKPASTSIFGAELFGEKSLDEVILSYLAEDLDPPHK